jgi:hypothetical protein
MRRPITTAPDRDPRPRGGDLDYIREDGAWKFHRIRARLTFQSPYHKGWVKGPVASSSGAFLDIAPTRPSTYHVPYNPYRITCFSRSRRRSLFE